ncbi:MAG: electron transfer flavoprotein subunit alpha/FixB family protein [candidate division Zixibacteria bacterium]|jgi:electron transfer flavoprotein alpha subunit|nr:electron transfer flavoprotein subunit alpha/FixB family protein [candidate division Zixibacteria bacterium]
MPNGFLVFAEMTNNQIAPLTKQALGIARTLADGKGLSVAAIVIGNNVSNMAESLAKFGADKIYYCHAPELENFLDESYAKVIAETARREEAKYILGGASFIGKELFPRLAVMMNSGLVPDITAIEWDGDNLLATKPIYGGKAIVKISPAGPGPQIVTIRPKAFPEATENPAKTASIEIIDYDDSKYGARAKVLEKVKEGGQTVSLTDADIIVSGGRGLRDPANFSLIRELADALGAAVGASRATVDAGWIPYAHQVGQTGKTVNPKLYIACGISGAIQHLVGMQSSKIIVAINRDPEAPIFKVATYGIVGDLFEILPKLTAKIKG